ncbi:MAG: kynurenine formamidase [Candidatus Poriferisodalaceae bacterium]|jgi:kynurenine formamidase
MGPVVARGVIGLKVANGDTDSYFMHADKPVLNGDYRITIADIEKCMSRQHISRGIGPGDVPIMDTGWTHTQDDPSVYLTQEPGIYLAEARYFNDRRVALVAADTWGLETLNPDVTGTGAFVCHQELITKTGTRIGESFVCDAAVADHAYEGVVVITPENVPGATCSSAAPVFIAQPGPKPHTHS